MMDTVGDDVCARVTPNSKFVVNVVALIGV